MLTKQDFDRLLEYEGRPAASLYMPRHLGSRDVRQDPARLRNLLKQAETKLAETGVRPEQSEALLKPAYRLAIDGAFWRQQSHGLALFLGDSGMTTISLPFEPTEQVIAGERFHLFPLLVCLTGDRPFLVLTVSARKARLYWASRDHIRPEPLELPKGVDAIAERTDYEATRGSRPTTHATGAMPTDTTGNPPEDNRKVELIEYLRQVSRLVDDHVRREKLPIVLVALPEIQGHFRALGHHPELLFVGVPENPDALDEGRLHARALETIQPILADRKQETLQRFDDMRGGKRVSVEVNEIAEAARSGRVDTLFLSEECEQQVEPAILDTAIDWSLRNGAQAHILQQALMPDRAPAAAIFRY
ncbi:MAG TPA: hypothetical protein VL286_05420 [Rhizomicrobium sp.]|jgi:hypothetical protein|nr:hypothetical protein [Rhizomicrobium sp.]